ncbi:O-methyltransferase [Rurimicrobium arvi]|uniref:O-methyltransferase n=1 Tax=Rurimicrobium arvi TaxID=2049916 RepID=A0ABP8MSV6_9BACT
MTTELFDVSLNRYAEQMSSDQLPVLAALERETHMRHTQSVMISGNLQGQLLQLISHLCRPRRVLEIGTYTGYSALCLAQGLTEDGVLHTVEMDDEKCEIVEKYIAEAGMEGKIVTHFGDARQIVRELDESWDIVFIDADKPSYGLYFDLVIEKMKSGGVIIADNVLFEGKVLLPEEKQGKNEKAMHLFNQKLKNDDRVAQVMLPIRDGISVIRKL